MSLAAKHRHVTRTRIIDDALHQAGLADAGFPLDCQRRRPPLAELADCGRSQAELGLPPHESLRRGHPQASPHVQSFPHASVRVQPKAGQRGQPAEVPAGRLVTPGYRARAPIGSQAGSTIGSASRAPCRLAGSALLRAAISKTYWPNQESFIVKKPSLPRSEPQLFSTRQRRVTPSSTSTPVKSIACVIALSWYARRAALSRSNAVS